jgi:serine/threonine-protein kinase
MDSDPVHKYRVLRCIGQGGMAEVFTADMLCQPGYSKRVAVKRVLPRLTRNARFMRMFLDEARIGLLLNHSNIVQVFDVGRAEGSYFIVMEYVDGANLRDIWVECQKRRTLMPLEISLAVIIDVCRALYYAHCLTDVRGNPLNVIHHDVNLANVLVSVMGEVKLMDFGLSEAAGCLEQSEPDVVRGKFGYISPEAAHGLRTDARSDQFSLGVVLYELVTGQRLFKGQDDLHSLALTRATEVPPPRAVNPEIPLDLEQVLLRALARDPAQRFSDMRDMANHLTMVLFDLFRPVNAFSIGDFVQIVRGPGPEDRSSRAARIAELIEDELLHFESLEYDETYDDDDLDGDATNVMGTAPVVDPGD